MPIITLPDGKNLNFEKKVSGLDIAEKISKSLAKQAMIIGVNGELKDLDFIIDKDCEVKIFTSKNKEGLEIIRHDTAHIMAMAVQELFPGTQVTIGPVIENGFYYDFARKEPFTEDDLNKIEVKMKEIVDRDEITKREVWDRDKAIKHFKKKGEIYKAELDFIRRMIGGSLNLDTSILKSEHGSFYQEYITTKENQNNIKLMSLL